MLGLEPDDDIGLKVEPIPGAIEDDLLLAGIRLVDRRFNIRIDDGAVTVTELRPQPPLPADELNGAGVSPLAEESEARPQQRRARNWPWSVVRRKLAQRRQH